MDKLERAVLASWDQWGMEGPCPSSLGWTVLSRTHVKKSVVKLVHPSSGKSIVVAKIPNTPATNSLIRKEYAHLEELGWKLQGHPSLLRTIPRVLAFLEQDDVPILIEEAIQGQHMAISGRGLRALGYQDREAQTMRMCLEWLIDFHRAINTTHPILQHGDFISSNVYAPKNGTLQVIDWEHFGKYPPCFDLFSLLFIVSLSYRSKDTGDALNNMLSNFERAYYAPSWLNHLASTFVDQYCRCFHLDKEQAPQWFLEYLTIKQAQLESLYGPHNIHVRIYEAVIQRYSDQHPLFLKATDSG